MPVQARLRFGPLNGTAIPKTFRGDSVDVWCDFRDIITGALVDVSTVTATVWQPGGAEVDPALTPTEEAAGTWLLNIPTAYSGTWSVSMRCASPNVSLDRRDFIVEALSPDTGPAPDPEWPVLVDLVEQAEAAVTNAEAHAIEAATSAGSSFGPVLFTVNGGTSTAYTATASLNPVAGRFFAWTPSVQSGAPTITLAVNGGTARSIRQADGTQPVEGMFPAGVTRLLLYTASNTFLDIGPLDTDDLVRPTLYWQSVKGPTDTAVRNMIAQLVDGRILFRTMGDGSTTPDYSFEFDDDFRPLVGKVLTVNGVEHYHPGNKPLAYRQINEAIGDVLAPVSEVNTTPVRLESNQRYTISGKDRDIYIVGASPPLDCSGMFISQEVHVDVAATGSTVLIAPPGLTWRGAGVATQLAISADSSVDIKRNQSTIECTVRSIFTTTSGASISAPAIVTCIGGQSYAVRAAKHCLAGFQRASGLISADRSVRFIEGTAFGASAFLRYAPTVSTNYLWDQDGDTPGPNATAMRDALLADPDIASLGDIAWMHFLNDLTMLDATGTNTYADLVTSIQSFVAWLRSELSKPTLRFHFCAGPPGQYTSETVFPSVRWGAARRAVGEAVAAMTNAYIAPPFYDLALPYGTGGIDRHAGFNQNARWGERYRLHLNNVIDGATNWLGPVITTVTEEAADTYAITVDYGTGQLVQTEDNVAGFRILPAGTSLFDTPLTTKRQRWSSGSGTTAILRIYLEDGGGAGGRLVYPWGPLEEMQDPTTIMRALSPLTGDWMPLREYLPT